MHTSIDTQLRGHGPTRCAAALLVGAAVILSGGCAVDSQRAEAEPGAAFITLSPGLRVDHERAIVEIDAVVATDVHHPDTPDVYLELILTSTGMREYEALVATPVPASLIHAALLAAGFTPGRTGSVMVTEDGVVRAPARGDAIEVALVTNTSAGPPREDDAERWIRDENGSGPGAMRWVFAGSRERVIRSRAGDRAVYDADATGVIVGLTTFGSEVIALTETVSPESAIDEPVWLANAARMPAVGEPVIVRLRRPAGAGALTD